MSNTQSKGSTSHWLTAIVVMFSFSSASAELIDRNECANPPPGAVFCEDFEGSNPKHNFDDVDGNPDTENQIVSDPGPASNDQNRAIRLRVPAGQPGGSNLVKVLLGKYDKLYARWYIKFEPAFNFAAPNHGSGLAAGDRSFLDESGNRPSGRNFASFIVDYQPYTAKPHVYSYYRGMNQNCASPEGSCWGDSLPCVYDSGQIYCTKAQHRPAESLSALQAGRRYWFEQMLDMGTPTISESGANGRLLVWLDSQLLGDFRDL